MKVSEMWKGGFLDSEDLPENQDIKLTIESVRAAGEDDKGLNGKMLENPIISFAGAKKEAVLNRTNAKIIRRMYGNDTAGWKGKVITIHRTTCRGMGGDTVSCWRVKQETRSL